MPRHPICLRDLLDRARSCCAHYEGYARGGGRAGGGELGVGVENPTHADGGEEERGRVCFVEESCLRKGWVSE